ncbi:MAG: hypothetical protein QI223_05945 [Candidatus Korarchaeota archaeon]|nr:hypothetical protein [Candidatus Korarchaeota archaeon]
MAEAALDLLRDQGPLIHLGIASLLALVYAKRRHVVILPVMMFASLISLVLGIEAHESLLALAPIAAALIVFIAGLELDVNVFIAEKERLFLMFTIEASFLLSLLYILSTIIPGPTPFALVALMIASNEYFVLELKKIGKERIANVGIALSVMEDSLAVALVSFGVLAGEGELTSIRSEVIDLLAITALLVPILYTTADPFDRFLKAIDRLDARVLTTLLYLFLLISVGHSLHLPEAIPVFIGSLMLSLRGFDRETFHVVEGYLMLALLGFVSSFPFTLNARVDLTTFLAAAAYGLAWAFLAYVLRGLILFFSAILAGFELEDAAEMAMVLANTGEFGLIAIAGLLHQLPLVVALAAMFAYGFNLTLVSEVTNRVHRLAGAAIKGLPEALRSFLEDLSEDANRVVGDMDFRRWMYGSLFRLMVIYLILSASKLLFTQTPVFQLLLTILSMGVFISTIQHAYTYFERGIITVLARGAASLILALRLLFTYLALAPVMSVLEGLLPTVSRVGGPRISLSSPIAILGMFAIAYVINRASNMVVRRLVPERPAERKEPPPVKCT